ncbi:MAG TPA: rhodanese-like domain-containing protein [Aquimonas sp.]|jgi:rhodanese-related sulfurtransferase|nr:sulfurtransferase [Xanthomonadales bacterium]HRD71965.1 rhodanese-like domain-containing protein [Aquimonas sp.]HRF54346.1 rhodanese-like domain-containing protein [Aquimonas sp.]
MSLSASDLVAAAKTRISEVSVDALAAEEHREDVLIDVREPAEFEMGHLAGAINIPRGVLEFQVEAHPAMACAVDPALALRDRAITLYCRTGGRSALAADALQQMGFSKVRSMAGGITAWTERGHPVTTR